MGSINCDFGVAARAVQNNSILLVKEGRGRYQNLWGLPKGNVDDGETAETAIIRELREETGAEGTIIGLASVRSTLNDGIPAIFLCFDVTVKYPIIDVKSDEISESRWFKLSELKDLDWVSDTMRNLSLESLSDNRMSIHYTRSLSKSGVPYFVYNVNKHSEYTAKV